MSRVEVTDLAFSYGTGSRAARVLHEVSVRVADGTLTAVVGPSGCGKTTLLRLLAGFEQPTTGSIAIDGEPVAGPRTVPAHLRRVGVVPQEGALFPHLTLARNVGLGLPRRAASSRARVAELLSLGGLDGLGHRLPRELSGGQQQRAALLRALAPRPRVVLLDEPFGSLDAEVRVRLRSSVRELLAAEGATALLVTHDRDEALSLADAVVVMLDGTVAQAGDPATVYARPVSREVARMLGDVGILPAHAVPGGRLATALGDLPALGPLPEGPLEAVLRPEQVSVVVGGVGGVPATVTSAEYAGGTTRAVVRLDGSAQTLPALAPGVHVGDAVSISVEGPVHALPSS